MRTDITIIFSSLRGFKKNPSLLGSGTPTAAAGGHPSLASGYCGHHRPIRLQSCVYIHTALVRDDAALRLAMPLSCYYHKTQNGFCLSYYMTSCTLLDEPSETRINWASSGAMWRTQYYAPTISVQLVVFCNTEMSESSSPFF
jgi:hypothetical protein